MRPSPNPTQQPPAQGEGGLGWTGTGVQFPPVVLWGGKGPRSWGAAALAIPYASAWHLHVRVRRGWGEVEVRNFLQFFAILLNLSQFSAFSRHFSDLPILRACGCGPGPPLSCCVQCPSYSCSSCCLRYRNFPQFPAIFANWFDPPPPPRPQSPSPLHPLHLRVALRARVPST